MSCTKYMKTDFAFDEALTVTETNEEIYVQPSPDCSLQDILDECFIAIIEFAELMKHGTNNVLRDRELFRKK